eukprot:763042-Hanusia_phi.AAC.6
MRGLGERARSSASSFTRSSYPRFGSAMGSHRYLVCLQHTRSLTVAPTPTSASLSLARTENS